MGIKQVFNTNRTKFFIIARFTSEVISKIGYFLLFPFYIKYLGASGFGVITQISALSSILAPIATLGLTYNIIRKASGNHSREYLGQFLTNNIILVIAANVPIILLLFSSSSYINTHFLKASDSSTIVLISALYITLLSFHNIVNSFYRARLLMISYTGLETLQSILTVGGSIYLLVIKKGLNELYIWQCSVLLLLLLVKLIYLKLKENIPLIIQLFSKSELQEWIYFGFPLITVSISSWFLNLSDRSIIAYYFSSVEVGIYGAAYTLTSIITMLGAPFWDSMYPLMATSYNNNQIDQLQSTIQKFSKGFLLIAIPATMGLIICSSSILEILGTKQFVVPIYLFAFIALGVLVEQTSAPAQYMLYIYNKNKSMRNIIIIAGILNIILNIILVPKLGILGASISTLIANLFLVYYFFKIQKNKILNFKLVLNTLFLTKIIAASLLMSIFLLLIRQILNEIKPIVSLLISIPVSAIVYSIIILCIYHFNLNKIKNFDL